MTSRAVLRLAIQRGRYVSQRTLRRKEMITNIWRPLAAFDHSRTIFTEPQRNQNIGFNNRLIPQLQNPWGLQQRRTMMGPVARIMAQIGIALASAVGRAFMQAFMQQRAQMKAGKGGGAAAAATGFVKKDAMERQQALEILNVDENSTKEEIQSNYEKLFAANDPSKGGSFYLQSKIHRAKECLDADTGDSSNDEK